MWAHLSTNDCRIPWCCHVPARIWLKNNGSFWNLLGSTLKLLQLGLPHMYPPDLSGAQLLLQQKASKCRQVSAFLSAFLESLLARSWHATRLGCIKKRSKRWLEQQTLHTPRAGQLPNLHTWEAVKTPACSDGTPYRLLPEFQETNLTWHVYTAYI